MAAFALARSTSPEGFIALIPWLTDTGCGRACELVPRREGVRPRQRTLSGPVRFGPGARVSTVEWLVVQIRERAAHAWGGLGVALALIFGIPSLSAAGNYKRTPWWVWPGVAIAVVFFLGAVFFFISPLLRKQSGSTEKSEVMNETGTKPDPEPVGTLGSAAEIPRERIAYRVSGRGKARPVRPHIRNQNVAFDIHDDGEVDDIDSDIS